MMDSYSITFLMFFINLISTATIFITFYICQFFSWDELYASFNRLYGQPAIAFVYFFWIFTLLPLQAAANWLTGLHDTFTEKIKMVELKEMKL